MSKSKTNEYDWIKDRKIVGTIILLLAVFFQIFSFLNVPVISSLPRYTTGMALGFYNPLFYGFIIFLGLKMIFSSIISLPKWIKLRASTFVFLTLTIVFLSVGTGFYQKDIGWNKIGTQNWQTFELWYSRFTNGLSAWAPINTNGGFVGAFIYSFFAMITSGIGTLIISVVLIVAIFGLIITNNVLNYYKDLAFKRKLAFDQSREIQAPHSNEQPKPKIDLIPREESKSNEEFMQDEENFEDNDFYK